MAINGRFVRISHETVLGHWKPDKVGMSFPRGPVVGAFHPTITVFKDGSFQSTGSRGKPHPDVATRLAALPVGEHQGTRKEFLGY